MEGTQPAVGQFVPETPPVKQARRRKDEYNFEGMARLAQQNPGTPLLAATHVPVTRIKAVRLFTGDPFDTREGYIRVEMRDSQVEDDGKRYGDVYFTWIAHPVHTPPTTTTQQ